MTSLRTTSTTTTTATMTMTLIHNVKCVCFFLMIFQLMVFVTMFGNNYDNENKNVHFDSKQRQEQVQEQQKDGRLQNIKIGMTDAAFVLPSFPTSLKKVALKRTTSPMSTSITTTPKTTMTREEYGITTKTILGYSKSEGGDEEMIPPQEKENQSRQQDGQKQSASKNGWLSSFLSTSVSSSSSSSTSINELNEIPNMNNHIVDMPEEEEEKLITSLTMGQMDMIKITDIDFNDTIIIETENSVDTKEPNNDNMNKKSTLQRNEVDEAKAAANSLLRSSSTTISSSSSTTTTTQSNGGDNLNKNDNNHNHVFHATVGYDSIDDWFNVLSGMEEERIIHDTKYNSTYLENNDWDNPDNWDIDYDAREYDNHQKKRDDDNKNNNDDDHDNGNSPKQAPPPPPKPTDHWMF